MSFQQQIIEKLGEHKVDEVNKNIKNKILFQIQELILDGLFHTEKFDDDQKSTLEKYSDLIHLSMNTIGLTTLENFPQLNKVQIVSIYINYIFLD